MKELKINKRDKKIVKVREVEFSSDKCVVIAGPCTVESEEIIFESASKLSKMGVDILRGGCFKPRTSPYSFQGLEKEGIKYLYEAGKKYNMPLVSEVITLEQLDFALEYLDIIQIGTRNMYNYPLLKELGSIDKPVLLKRAFSATYEEWLLAAEYIVSNGNENVILCERGIRTFENSLRNTLDISAVPYMKTKTNLPIIVDPSHASGYREFIKSLSYAAIAAGADGLMIEVHPEPENALCDGRQSIRLDEFEEMMISMKKLSAVVKDL